ncbi:hypothetical protein [Arthrobacter sp. H5]|uniref:hypothetical protein n=1 Tax=Arthrobacter sp. H5 TaxID=1267973 RepID=UPI0004839ECA|nr:hypothetical protein [Arthrobacter sp. H5]
MPHSRAGKDDGAGLPDGWVRYRGPLLALWRIRHEAQFGPAATSHHADGIFVRDHRRPLAQWVNVSLHAAVLVAPTSPAEWPVQRFSIYYAPPATGFVTVHSSPHEWRPRSPRGSRTDEDAFVEAVAAAEEFLRAETLFSEE